MHPILNQQGTLFHSLNLNVVCMGNHRNYFNCDENNLLKAPNHEWKHWMDIRQTQDDVHNLPWTTATGLGIVLGFDQLMAIDIDGVIDFSFIKSICQFLSIPIGYKWIVKSGSGCGYHIILKCDDISFVIENEIDIARKTRYGLAMCSEHSPTFGSVDTNAYYPPFYNRNFNKVEFKWKGNLVMPPSLHTTGNNYSFLNGMPEEPPVSIQFEKLRNLKEKYCSLQAEYSEMDGHEMIIQNENGIETQINLNGTIKQIVAKPDEQDYNYHLRRNESAIIISSSIYRVTEMGVFLNVLNKPKALIQISWFVLDKNNNVIKRRTHNYFNANYAEDTYDNDVTYSISNRIIQSKQSVYHELLFDIEHVSKIISYHPQALLLIENEIKRSGLYLDSFKTKKLDFSQSWTSYFDSLENKETIFISNEDKNDLHIEYREMFQKEFAGVLNSLTKLQILLRIHLKTNGIVFEIPNFTY